jgi:hypothetical protein
MRSGFLAALRAAFLRIAWTVARGSFLRVLGLTRLMG